MIKKESYSILLVLLVSFVAKEVLGQCIVNVTIERGPVIPVNEKDGFVSVTLKRTGNTTIEAKVNVSTDENTAKAGEDFINIPPYQTVTFAANSTNTAVVNITIVNDQWMEELKKTFFLNLTTNDANVCTPLPTTTIEIEDDDKVTVGFNSDHKEFNENHGNFSLSFYKKNQTKIPITVSFSTLGHGGIESAVINTDYKNISGTMTFQESEFSKDFPNVGSIIDNNIVEATKCFNITLTSKDDRVVFVPQQYKICILNDEKATIEFASVNNTVAEQMKNVSIDITKNGTTAIPLEVRLNMLKRIFETAEKVEDYTSRHDEVITFGKDELKKTVWFTIDDDNVAESTEVFAVSLEAVDPITTIIGAKDLAVVLITDEEDREIHVKAQKQKEEDQKKRVQLLTILLFVGLGLIIVIIGALVIVVCLLKRRLKKDTH